MTTYVLHKKKNPKTSGYSKTPYPKSLGLPSVSIVVEQKDGISVERKIRYSKGQSSIYVDEQTQSAKATVEDLVFKDGILTVDDENKPNLQRYIDLLHMNGSNPNRNPNAPIKFYKLDIDAKFRAANEQEENKGSVLMEYMNLSIDKKRALSHYMGKPTLGKTDERWTYELLKTIQSSDKSMNQFKADLQNPILDRIEIISMGEQMELLKYGMGKWTLNGNVILSTDRSQKDKHYSELANFLIDNPETWTNVLDKVKGRNKELTSKASDATISDVSKNASNDDMTEAKAEKLFTEAKDAKVIAYSTGKGFALDGSDEYFGKSKNDAIAEIQSNPALQKAIKKLL